MKILSRRVFSSCAAALVLLSAPAFAEEGALLKLGTALGYPPFEYMGQDGKMTGFEIDLGNAICDYLKRRCEWTDIDFAGMIPALKARKFDAMIASVAITEDRSKQVDFSDKVWQGSARLVARKDAGILPEAASLAGKRVGVEQGTTNEKFARKRWATEGVTVVSYADQDTAYNDLISGRLDAMFVEGTQAYIGFLSQERGKEFAFAGERVSDPLLGDSMTGIAVPKGNDALLKDFNRALAALRADGTYDRIAAKYFPPSINIYGE